MKNIKSCPTCSSPDPRYHPATQHEGDTVFLCQDNFHQPKMDDDLMLIQESSKPEPWIPEDSENNQ